MKEGSRPPGGPITHRSLLRVLIAGFSLVIILLLTGAFIGIRNINSIKENAARLIQEQNVTNRLLGEVHRQQASTVTMKSTDGGKTWFGFRGAPGGDDYQNLWINPDAAGVAGGSAVHHVLPAPDNASAALARMNPAPCCGMKFASRARDLF